MGGRGASSKSSAEETAENSQPVITAGKLTQKQVTETYKGKRFDSKDPYSTITTIAFYKGIAVLLSGKYEPIGGGGYTIEAVVDMGTGKNLIKGRSRFADTKADAIDVALEMLSDF